MDRGFTWNKSREQLEYENAMAAAAAAGAMNGAQAATDADPNQYFSRDGMQQMPFPNMSQAYNQVMQQNMAQQAERAAKMQRLKELEAIRNQRMQRIDSIKNDPKMQMAAMMAMAGDNGMLQTLLMKDANETKNQTQADMDSLEDKMVNDIFALSGADKDQFDKITKALIPLYRSKFEELAGKGATSRLGGWEAWENAIAGAKASKAAKKGKSDAAKSAKRGAAVKFGR